MFDVLMFIFENYMDGNVVLKTDNETIVTELEKVGFAKGEIDGALDWLDGLSQFKNAVEAHPIVASPALRHFLPEETEQLGIEGCGFLIYLEQLGVLDPATREIVIDRVMAFETRAVDIGRVKWVVLMVLFSQPDKKAALSMLQDMILSDAFDVLH